MFVMCNIRSTCLAKVTFCSYRFSWLHNSSVTINTVIHVYFSLIPVCFKIPRDFLPVLTVVTPVFPGMSSLVHASTNFDKFSLKLVQVTQFARQDVVTLCGGLSLHALLISHPLCLGNNL